MMKGKALALLAVLVLVAGTAFAGPIAVGTGNEFTISNEELATMGMISPDLHGEAELLRVENIPDVNNVEFLFEFTGPDGEWMDAQVGWQMAGGPGSLPAEYWNLSDWDSLMLSFHNEGPNPIWVNLFMNTGWTDPPEDWTNDMYAQNGWTYLEHCQWTVLDLDFDNAER